MIEQIPQDAYRRRQGYSSSTVATAYRDPRLCRRDDGADTEAMLRGRIVHALTLEPHERPRYVVAPTVNLATTAGKAAWSEWLAQFGVTEYTNREGAQAALAAVGYDVIPQDDLDALTAIVDRVRSDHRVRSLGLLSGGIGEGSAFAEVPVDGDRCVAGKCRPDYYIPASRTLVQLKTGAGHHLSPERWRWTMAGRGYDIAEAWCAEVLARAGHPVDVVAWVCAATDAPLVHVYTAQVDSAMMQRAYDAACIGALRLEEFDKSPLAWCERHDVVTDIGSWSIRGEVGDE